MLDRMIGQSGPLRIVRRRIGGRSAAHAFLFHGEAHLGKGTLARLFAQGMNCATRDACGSCPACRAIDRGVFPFVSEVRRDWGEIPVQQMRDRVKPLSLTAPEGVTKFLIIDDAANLNVSSANMLLKTLEEPPGGTVIVLVSQRPERLLPTIRSRCEPVAFGRADASLLRAAIPADRPDKEALLDAADGRPGVLRILLDDPLPPEDPGGDLIRLAETAYDYPASPEAVARLTPAELSFEPLRRFLIGRSLLKARIAASLLSSAAGGTLFAALCAASCVSNRIAGFFDECEERVGELLKASADGIDPQAAKELVEEGKRRIKDFRAAEVHDIIQFSVRHCRNVCVDAATPAAGGSPLPADGVPDPRDPRGAREIARRNAVRDLETLGAIRDAHRSESVNSDGLIEAAVASLRRRRLEKP